MDLYLQRLMDIFLSFPLIILALALVAILGNSIPNVILAITIPMIPRCALVIRSSALAIREMPYVDAARAAGFGHARIILRHMLPNVMAPYLIMLTAFLGQAILLEASLSFLGLGVQEPTAAWGLMLGRGGGVRRDGAVDGDLPGAGHQPGRLRLQPLRRLAARRPGSEAPHPVVPGQLLSPYFVSVGADPQRQPRTSPVGASFGPRLARDLARHAGEVVAPAGRRIPLTPVGQVGRNM